MAQFETSSEPDWIGWKKPGDTVHICGINDFSEQVIGAAMLDIYPESLWDSLLGIKGILGETNYVEYKEFVRNTGPLSINRQTEGHPFLIQEGSPHKQILSLEYQKELSQIKVIYIYEDLDKNPTNIQKYKDQLNSTEDSGI